MSIENNLIKVEESIRLACLAAGRRPEEVRLVAVSKTQPIEFISEAFRAGQKIFGENYVQEAVKKVALLPAAEWHFIGSLQTNKVKDVVGSFSLIHSVDRIKLAKEIHQRAVSLGRVQDILLQVHVGGEESKHGVSLENAEDLLEVILSLPGLRLRGMMSMPPLTEDEKVSRGYFSLLREAFCNYKKAISDVQNAKLFSELSMGTSSDFEWAISEGSTMVRVGTAIFGPRQYK